METKVLSDFKKNNERIMLIQKDDTTNEINRLKVYNKLYEMVFNLEKNDILETYLFTHNIKNVILYGYTSLTLFLNKKIKEYKFINTVYVVDEYIKSDEILNIQEDKELINMSDIIIVIPVHAYERIKQFLIIQNIEPNKIVDILTLIQKKM